MDLNITPHPIGQELGAAFRVFLLVGVAALPLGLAVAAAAFWRRRQGLPPFLRLPVLLVVLIYGLNLVLLLAGGAALVLEAVSSGTVPAILTFVVSLFALNLVGGAFWVYVLRRVRPDEPIRLGLG
jgi:hypothetical protein